MYLNFLNLTLSWPTKLFSGVNWRILWSRPQDWLQYYIICGYWHGSRFYCSMDKRCSFTWLDSDVFALNELDPHKSLSNREDFLLLLLLVFLRFISLSTYWLYYALYPTICYLLVCDQENVLKSRSNQGLWLHVVHLCGSSTLWSFCILLKDLGWLFIFWNLLPITEIDQ